MLWFNRLKILIKLKGYVLSIYLPINPTMVFAPLCVGTVSMLIFHGLPLDVVSENYS